MSVQHQHRPGLLQQLELRPLGPEHVDDIAALHFRELSWSFNGQFGQDHIRDLYATLLSCPCAFGYVVYQGHRVLGFTTATSNSVQTRRAVVQVYRRKLAKTAGTLLRHPLFALGVLESRFLVPAIFRKHGTTAEWLTLLTDTERAYIAPFVGLRLIDAVRQRFAELGFTQYMAQGVRDNPRAMQFYEKLQWQVVAALPVHNIYLYRTASSATVKAG